MDEETNPRTVVAYSPGILLAFYSGKAPTRLIVVLFVLAIKPFADEMANHASHDSNNKRNDNFHVNTSSRCQASVGQHEYYILFSEYRQWPLCNVLLKFIIQQKALYGKIKESCLRQNKHWIQSMFEASYCLLQCPSFLFGFVKKNV